MNKSIKRLKYIFNNINLHICKKCKSCYYFNNNYFSKKKSYKKYQYCEYEFIQNKYKLDNKQLINSKLCKKCNQFCEKCKDNIKINNTYCCLCIDYRNIYKQEYGNYYNLLKKYYKLSSNDIICQICTPITKLKINRINILCESKIEFIPQITYICKICKDKLCKICLNTPTQQCNSCNIIICPSCSKIKYIKRKKGHLERIKGCGGVQEIFHKWIYLCDNKECIEKWNKSDQEYDESDW
jgi:hypothetical protein